MSKVCVFFATGFEEIEALTVVDLLRRAGILTDMVSVTGEREVTSSHQVTVRTDKLLDEVDFDGVDMLVLPGGMPGTVNLEQCAALMEQVDAFDRAGKCVSAICAAPGILGKRGLLKGRKACSFPDHERFLEGAEVSKRSVEVSEHITTGRGMGCAIDFGLAIVERYQGKKAAEELAGKIVYRR